MRSSGSRFPQAPDFTKRLVSWVEPRSLARPKQPWLRHSITLGGSGIDRTPSPEVEVHARRCRQRPPALSEHPQESTAEGRRRTEGIAPAPEGCGPRPAPDGPAEQARVATAAENRGGRLQAGVTPDGVRPRRPVLVASILASSRLSTRPVVMEQERMPRSSMRATISVVEIFRDGV